MINSTSSDSKNLPTNDDSHNFTRPVQKCEILGIFCTLFSWEQYKKALSDALLGKIPEASCVTIHTVNPEMLVDAHAHPAFLSVLSQATWCIPDGSGIAYALSALYDTACEDYVHPGVDTLEMLLDLAYTTHARIAVCGARPLEHKAFQELAARKAPGCPVLCKDPGLIDERDPHVPLVTFTELQAFAPDILFVALGQGKGLRQGKQEYIVQEFARLLPKTKVIIGVGGALDMLSGRVARSPWALRRRGLEWLYRVSVQPWRGKRIAKAVVVFPLLIAKEAIMRRRFIRACSAVIARIRCCFFS